MAVAVNLCEEEKIVACSVAVWYPTFFPDKCDGCEGLKKPHSIEFCPYGVFELRDGKALVVNPHECVYESIACERLCPKKAIAFPQRIATMPKIRSENKGLLRKIKCRNCSKIFWSNRDIDLCFDCEK